MPTAAIDCLCRRLPLRLTVTILSFLVALAAMPGVGQEIIPLPGGDGVLNSPGVTDITDGETLILRGGSIASNTTINLFTGGELRTDVRSSPWVVNLGSDNLPTSNIELNIIGGEFFIADPVRVHEGSTVNISGGTVQGQNLLSVRSGGTVNVSGGYVAGLYSWNDSNISITGGLVDLRFANQSGSLYTTSISGGALAPIDFAPWRFYHRFDLAGGDWAVDGVPIEGLAAIGDTSNWLLQSDSTLTGVLSDGTPIALSTRRGDYSLLNLQLELTEIASVPGEVYASQSVGLTGARSGQTVFVDSGAALGRGFRAASGSLTHLQAGGFLNEYSEFYSAVLDVAGGTVARGGLVWGGGTLNLAAGTVEQFTLRGEATANISGGTATLVSNADSESGVAPTINITGGEVIGVNLNGGVVNLSAGTLAGEARLGQVVNVSGSGLLLDGFRGRDYSKLNVSGGLVGAVRVDGDLVASGGVFAGGVNATSGDLMLIGSDFRYEGELVAGLENVGEVVFQASASPTGVGLITGTLADGTPIAFTGYDLSLRGGVRFQLAETVEPPAPALTVTSEEAPRFAVKNQSVTVVAGGTLRQGFTAGPGASVEIQTGGVAGEQLEAIGATIHVIGGEVGEKSLLTAGSTLEISAGIIGNRLSVRDGSQLRVLGGSVGDLLNVRGASTVVVHDGSLGETSLYDTASLQVAGGYVEKMNAEDMSQLNVTGGRIVESPDVEANARLTLYGSGFLLDGVSVEELVSGPFAQLGDTVMMNLGVGQILTGELADGTPVVLSPTNTDRIADGTLTLVYDQPVAAVPATYLASAGPTPAGIRNEQELRVDAGTMVYSPIAGPGGRIEVQPGGTVTGALDAIDADVQVTGATIEKLRGYQGARLNVNASQVDRLEVTHGSQLVLDGGAIGEKAKILYGSVATITGGVAIGRDLLISNSTVVIGEATIGWNMDIVDQSDVLVSSATLQYLDIEDSTFEFSGGVAEGRVDAARSTIRIGGGLFERDLRLEESSQMELSGGLIHGDIDLTASHAEITGGEWFGWLEANQSSVNVDAHDAPLGRIELGSGSSLDFQSGQMPQLAASEGSVTNVYEGRIEGLDDYNASVTIHGGEINELDSRTDNSNPRGFLTIAGGRIVDLSLRRINGATQTGGLVEKIYVDSGSQYRISGGAIGDNSSIYGQLRMTGGTIGRSNDAKNGEFSLVGGEFELNGVPVAGLGSVGNSTTLQLVDGDLLSGVLQDGTPIALGGLRSLGTGSQNDHDVIRTVNLSRVGLPVAAPQITTGTDGVPAGARPGQSVTFTPGSMSEGRFRAGRNSYVIVQADSQLGDHLEAFGATIDVDGGTVGDGALIHDGATLNLSAGRVGERLRVNTSGRVNITGGTIADGLIADSSGLVVLSGNSFVLDGEPLTGLVEGTTYYVGNLSGKRISGVLEDGTPILLSESYVSSPGNAVLRARQDLFGLNDIFTSNTDQSLAIHITPAAPLGSTQITASTDPIPYGIRGGQTIMVDAGSQLPRDFNAGIGSRVEVLTGGSVGENLEAVGAVVEIRGGAVGDFFEAWDGAEVLLDSGSMGRYAYIASGSRFEMRNGTVGDDLVVQAERFEMTNGTIGRDAVIHAETILISGGEFGEAASLRGNMTISSGRFSNVSLTTSNGTDRIHITGGEFTSRASILGSGEISGGNFGENSFFRGRDSNQRLLEIAGGNYAPGTTFDEDIRITGGEFANTILDDDVWVDGGLFLETVFDGYGTVVTDGIFRGETSSNSSSYVRIEGGAFERFHPRRVGIYGGEFETIILDRNGELSLYGNEFFLDGLPLALNPEGTGLEINARDGVLTGTLADGSTFSLELNQFFVPGEDFVSAEASLQVNFANPLGDYDGDSFVSGSDFLRWQRGESPNDLSLLDLERWKGNYGSVTSSLSSSLTTPEPSAQVLGILATLLGAIFRRSR